MLQNQFDAMTLRKIKACVMVAIEKNTENTALISLAGDEFEKFLEKLSDILSIEKETVLKAMEAALDEAVRSAPGPVTAMDMREKEDIPSKKPYKRCGDYLRTLRLSKGWSRSDLAEKLDLQITSTYLNQVENGYRPLPEKLVEKYALLFERDETAFRETLAELSGENGEASELDLRLDAVFSKIAENDPEK